MRRQILTTFKDPKLLKTRNAGSQNPPNPNPTRKTPRVRCNSLHSCEDMSTRQHCWPAESITCEGMLTLLTRSAAALVLLPTRTAGFLSVQMSSAPVAAGGALNVLGKPLQGCSLPGGPTTGWRRDGFCSTDDNDHGQHCVCSEVTEEFLDYTKNLGNDLSTPRLPHFPGLKPGDRWCLCSSRWLQAQQAGKAPLVVLDSTHERATDVVPLEVLMQHSSSAASTGTAAATTEEAAATKPEEL